MWSETPIRVKARSTVYGTRRRVKWSGPSAASGSRFREKKRFSASSGPTRTRAGSFASCARWSSSPVSASKSVCTVRLTSGSTCRLSSRIRVRTSRVRSASGTSPGRTNVKAPGAVASSPGIGTPSSSRLRRTRSAAPGSPAGDRNDSRVESMTQTSSAGPPRTRTSTVGLGGGSGASEGAGGGGRRNPAPVMVTSVLPPVGPEAGSRVVISGVAMAASHSIWNFHMRRQDTTGRPTDQPCLAILLVPHVLQHHPQHT